MTESIREEIRKICQNPALTEANNLYELWFMIHTLYGTVDVRDLIEFLTEQDLTPQEIVSDWADEQLPPFMFYGCNVFGNGKIILPKHIKMIDQGCFKYSTLHSIECPEVTEIEKWAFAYSDLKSIITPSVQFIGYKAFSHSPLKYFTVPETIVEINQYAFDYCPELMLYLPKQNIGPDDEEYEEFLDWVSKQVKEVNFY